LSFNLQKSNTFAAMFKFFRKLFSKKAPTYRTYEFQEIYDKIGFEPINSEDEYIKALTHSSFTKSYNERNERLEFLGDSVLNFVVAYSLYHSMPNKDEGMLSKARAHIVNRKNLNRIGTEIGIKKYLRHKLTAKQIEEAPDIVGNAFEAFIGAFYNEYGLHETETLLAGLLFADFDAQNFHTQITDFKSYFLEWCQAKKKSPFFEHTSNRKAENLFEVNLFLDNTFIASAVGKNKKEAEINACKLAIEQLNL